MVVVVLGLSSYVEDPAKCADLMLARFFISQHSDSDIYPDGIMSFSKVIEKNDTLEESVMGLEESLTKVFQYSFDTVDVSVTNVSGTASKGELSVRVKVGYKGKEYDIYDTFRLKDGLTSKIVKINNG